MRFEIFAPEMQFLAILENVVVANYGLVVSQTIHCKSDQSVLTCEACLVMDQKKTPRLPLREDEARQFLDAFAGRNSGRATDVI